MLSRLLARLGLPALLASGAILLGTAAAGTVALDSRLAATSSPPLPAATDPCRLARDL